MKYCYFSTEKISTNKLLQYYKKMCVSIDLDVYQFGSLILLLSKFYKRLTQINDLKYTKGVFSNISKRKNKHGSILTGLSIDYSLLSF